MSLFDRIFALIQYPLPHHLLSRLVYWLTRCPWPPLKNIMIRVFIKHFRVDMGSAQHAGPEHFNSFNEFFTRALKPEARPIAAAAEAIACPVDGTVSQAGKIEAGRIFQAKGHDYSLATLLGDLPQLHDCFADGQFATIYLSPRDYHRIHMPVDGRLRESVYVPGRLFSVNAATTRAIPGLFARNERLVTVFDTPSGPVAVILVGAIFVAGIETVWQGNYGARTFRPFEHRRQAELPQVTLSKGEELGRFNMGSTVILLFPPGMSEWSADLQPQQTVRMGQAIGRLL